MVLEDKESKVMAHGWLTGAVDRRLCSSRLADLRSDHGPRNCDRAAMWLPATETQSADQTSVFHRYTQAGGIRDKRKPGLHPSHYNVALGCVTLNFSVCAHVFVFCLKGGEFTGCHKWLTDPQWQLGNFKKNKASSMKAWKSLSTLCKHIRFTLRVLWFQNQYQISASIQSARRFFSCQWSKTKLLHLIYTAYSFHLPQGLSR